ncbi:MAG: DUF2924 domain-containing protein [Deltaproteobacteria bacterium]|nr:DUF2924 domain-containing protein [Deltaproteobacteria bacterium]
MATKKSTTTAQSTALTKELAVLAKLTKTALWKRYAEVFGKKTKSSNVAHLRAAIAKELVKRKTSAAAAPSASPAPTASGRAQRLRDPRLPAVGTVLERTYHDAVHKVRVLDDGFEYLNTRYRSLSGIAKAITGHEYNGFLFFGLVAAKRTATPASAGA